MKFHVYFLVFLFTIAVSKAVSPEWIVWDVDNSDLTSNDVFIAAPDSTGYIYLCAQEFELAKYDGTKGWDKFNQIVARDVVVDRKNLPWVCSIHNKAYKITPDSTVELDTLNSGLPDELVRAIGLDSKGNKWFVTTNYLVRYNDNAWTWFELPVAGFPRSITDNETKDTKAGNELLGGGCDRFLRRVNMVSDSSGNIWIGTFGAGIWKFDGNDWTAFNKQNSGLRGDTITALAVDKNQNLWAGYISNSSQNVPKNDLGGIMRFDGLAWTNFKPDSSYSPNQCLSGMRISSIAADRNGDVYFGQTTYPDILSSGYNSLFKFDGSTFVKISPDTIRPFNAVQTIRIDGNGTKWIGTFSGLYAFNEGGIEGYTMPVKPKNFLYEIECGENSIKLFWGRDTTNPNLYYRIFRKNLFETNFTLLADYIFDTVYVDTTAKQEQIYYYQVRSYDTVLMDMNKSNNSLQGKLISRPAPPLNVSLLIDNNLRQVTLHWDSSVTPNVSYRISRSGSPESDYKIIKDDCQINEYTDKDISVENYYIVQSKGNVTGLLSDNAGPISAKLSGAEEIFANSPVTVHPNPFSASAIIEYTTTEASAASLAIYNELGEVVFSTVNSYQEPGLHRFTLEAGNFTQGVYLYRLRTGAAISQGKIVVVK